MTKTAISTSLLRGVSQLTVESNEESRNPVGATVERRVVDLAVRRAGGRPVPKDRLIADLAGRQYGVVARRQLVAMGIGDGAIDTRLKRHGLHRLHRGVYAVGHLALVPLAREMAAVLACGDGSAISHRSAAEVWHLVPVDGRAPVDVTVGRAGGRRAGIRAHSSRSLSADAVKHLRGLPITAPDRTLIDLADVATDRELERATHEAITRHLVNARHLRAQAERYSGRRGIARIKELLAHEGPTTLTRSEAEERFLALVRAGGLPGPEVNVRVGSYEVDFLWREHRLAVEIDGFRFHSSRAAFERDRKRDADLQRLGLSVLRFTWRQVVDQQHATLATLAGALQRA
jgi:very-short-patch-repair endonuclease